MSYVPVPCNEFVGWYEIPGYSGYCANRRGEILTKKTRYTTKGGRAGRYLKVSVYPDGSALPHLQYVHILVCRAFKGLPDQGMVVLHDDDDRFNNAPTNLNWGTQSTNILDTYRTGLRKPTYGPRRVSIEEYDEERTVTLFGEEYALSLLQALAIDITPTTVILDDLTHVSTDHVTPTDCDAANHDEPLLVLNGVSLTVIDGFAQLAHSRQTGQSSIKVRAIEPSSLGLEVGVESAKAWDPRFTPCYTPKEMLEKGIFEGKYINAVKGLPGDWYKVKKVLGPKDEPDPKINQFGVKSRMSLSDWKKNGWIKTDKNGWFEWYCRYYLGRRLGDEDNWQIGRWVSLVARHQGQINKTGKRGDLSVNPRQRQGLLQWGWDSTKPFDDETRKRNLTKFKKLGVGVESHAIFDHW